MLKVNPNYKIRYIPWPKANPKVGFFDVYDGGFERVVISKKVKDIKRLVQYFDWFYSDEGLDILTWGPPNTGVWTMQGGKKVFNKDIEQDMLTAARGKKGADYFGLFDYTSYLIPFLSKAAICAPKLMVGNPVSYLRSYAPKPDVFSWARSVYGRAGMDYSGNGSYGDGGENNTAFQNYFWSIWQNGRVAKVLNLKSDADFDKAWAEQMKLVDSEAKAKEAKADMIKWYSASK
jgi:hypothetical protein